MHLQRAYQRGAVDGWQRRAKRNEPRKPTAQQLEEYRHYRAGYKDAATERWALWQQWILQHPHEAPPQP